MRAPLAILILFISYFVYAQSPADTLGNIYDDLNKKNRGTVAMADGAIHTGYIEYDIYTDVMRFGHNSKSITNAIPPKNVTGFEYFDEQRQRRRVFTTVDTPDGMQYFEVLRKTENDGIFFRTIPTRMKSAVGKSDRVLREVANFVGLANWNYFDPSWRPRRRLRPQKIGGLYVTQQKAILAVWLGLEIFPYAAYTKKDVDNVIGTGMGWGDRKTSVKIIDRSIPKRLFGERYEVVKKYAAEKNLSWSDLDDFLRIYDYYNNFK